MADVPLDTIAGEVRAETEVLRSRFLATLAPVSGEEVARTRLAEVRREFPDARHHCSAFVLGLDGQQQRSNDDGEPAGTAGAPMLAVLRGAEVSDVLVVVTRWFGGTLLGAGGLVRAYGEAVTAALHAVTRVPRRPVALLSIEVGHAEAGRLEHQLRAWIADAGGRLDDVRYGADGVSFAVAVPPAAAATVRSHLAAAGIDHALEERGEGIRELRR